MQFATVPKNPLPGGFPRRALGRSRSSERDLVVAVDQLGVFVFGRLRAAQEVDLLGDDLAAVAIGAGCVGPLGVMEAAVNEDLHAFFAMLRDR